MILKYSTLNMCLIKAKHKSKHLSERSSTILKGTKTEFCWTDNEIELLLESANQYRCKCEYEGINQKSVCSKYERMQEIFIDSYTKNNVKGNNVPVLDNLEVISKDRVAAKLNKNTTGLKKSCRHQNEKWCRSCLVCIL